MSGLWLPGGRLVRRSPMSDELAGRSTEGICLAKGLPCSSAKSSRDAYRAWLFEQQKGICYLGLHPRCKAVGCAMSLETKPKHRFATFEHVIPKCQQPVPVLILLACSQCNGLKHTRAPDFEHVALARELRKLWCATKGGAMPKVLRGGRAAQMKIEAEQRAWKASLGLKPGVQSSKKLAKLRSATGRALGR